MRARDSLTLVAAATWGLGLGCSGEQADETDGQRQLAESFQVWTELKGSSERQYRYTSTDASWTGYHWRTTLQVANDAVVSRAYERFDPEGMLATAWTEDTASLGSHPEGAPLLTIDQVYEGCSSEVLTKDPAQNWITLTFGEHGVLHECSYFPKTCADDCARGFDVHELELL